MRPPLIFETVALVFFALFAIATFFTRASRERRIRVALLSSACAAGAATAAFGLPMDARLWLGHGYLVAGYWIPGLLVGGRARGATRNVQGAQGTGQSSRGSGHGALCTLHVAPEPSEPSGAFESWLLRTEERCRPLARHPPAWCIPLLELSYLFCYVMVPLAFVVMWSTTATASEMDRFWTAVLLAGFACYGTLPWLVSRPPRVVERTAARGVGHLNVYVLGRVSHGFNTFPSGHVAVSAAAALEVISVSAPAGALLSVIAAGIAAGAVAGRYHYTIDVAAGLAIGLAAAVLI